LRYTLLYIAVIFTIPLQGQITFDDDTIKIKEVVITRNKSHSDLTGYKVVTFDTSALKIYSHNTLADILSENSMIFIKSYGMGGVATPSFRGTGASHTLLTWNNINISNPMLGQSDLSLIPSGLADDIQIYFGGASMSENSGGIGSTINLESKPVWKKETSLTISPEIGSFDQYSGLLKLKSGNDHFQSVTKAFLQASENDFRFLNSEATAEPVWETRANNQIRQQGFIQELYYRKENNILSARLWYQSVNRNLPSSMLIQQQNSDEKQFDESLRTMLNYEKSEGKNNFYITGAWIFNRLNYSNRLASIDSRNISETFTIKTGIENQIASNTKLRVYLNQEVSYVKSSNYNKNSTRNTTTLTASAESNLSDRFGTMFLIREIFDNKSFLLPDFSAALQLRLISERDYFIKANISRNSKIPTMNDLFWVPGGNPDLKNEYAFIYEVSYEMEQKILSGFTVNYDISLFRNSIKDMILWHPGESWYWTADNIQSVNSNGIETSVRLLYKISHFTSVLNAGYTFTKAINAAPNDISDISAGKQLMYIPENQANASFNISSRSLYFVWSSNLTGRRYITVDNSKYLPAFFLNNIITGVKVNLKGNIIDASVNINNVFNINYQTIAHFPLPGRSYEFKILFQIIK
jgi:vitamin B12 transporter